WKDQGIGIRDVRQDIPKKCTVWLEGLIYEVNQDVGSKGIQICKYGNNRVPFEIIFCMHFRVGVSKTLVPRSRTDIKQSTRYRRWFVNVVEVSRTITSEEDMTSQEIFYRETKFIKLNAMLLKKLLEKLGDPGKFLIPCDFPEIDLSIPELTPTRMTLELANRSITRPKGVPEDVFVKVEKFHFLADFVVVDFEADPRVPLILGRSFLRTGRALIDVYGEEITLWVNDEAVTFNLN
nr:reverse transcriptase domain-containing protein [Tanacetum cinerariifolium]